KPIDRFVRKPKSFWASVRSLSQHIGYSKRDRIIAPDPKQMAQAFDDLGLDKTKIIFKGQPTLLAEELSDYFAERSRLLMHHVEPRLMDVQAAKKLFTKLHTKLQPKCPIPMNKQKGDKRAEAFLTGIVNMLIEQNAGDCSCDYDPRELTTIT